jgi:hypothetical protein
LNEASLEQHNIIKWLKEEIEEGKEQDNKGGRPGQHKKLARQISFAVYMSVIVNTQKKKKKILNLKTL